MKLGDQIKKGVIKVITDDVLIIDNYPMGFKTCQMTFKKAKNRNGAIIERTSLFNGKTSKPKKTTAYKDNFFIYDEELKKHFIVSISGFCTFTIYTTSFYNANADYENYYISPTSKEYVCEANDNEEYFLLFNLFKDILGVTPEAEQKLKEYCGEVV